MKKIAAIPTMLTLGNALCGFLSIGYVAKAREELTFQRVAQTVAAEHETLSLTFTEMAQKHGDRFGHFMQMAGWMVLLAMVFDALDGKLARLVKVETDFGAQLDSLADGISFGVAPALLAMAMSIQGGFVPQITLIGKNPWPAIAWAGGVLFIVCVLMRLARYNVEATHDPEGTQYFSGLPSPAGGGMVASLVMMRYHVEDIDSQKFSPVASQLLPVMKSVSDYLPLLLVLLAFLMVSRVRYIHVLNRLLGDQEAFGYLILVIVVAAFIFFTWPFSITLVFLLYIISGLPGGLRDIFRGRGGNGSSANGEA
jgi:CDP-diacylglycerol---serine O-phosphatidyltransferase